MNNGYIMDMQHKKYICPKQGSNRGFDECLLEFDTLSNPLGHHDQINQGIIYCHFMAEGAAAPKRPSFHMRLGWGEEEKVMLWH